MCAFGGWGWGWDLPKKQAKLEFRFWFGFNMIKIECIKKKREKLLCVLPAAYVKMGPHVGSILRKRKMQ